MRIVRIVENDETGVDRLVAISARNDGPRMSAKTALSLDQGDVVIVRKKMRGSHSGNTPANDSNGFAGCVVGFKWHSYSTCSFHDVIALTAVKSLWMKKNFFLCKK